MSLYSGTLVFSQWLNLTTRVPGVGLIIELQFGLFAIISICDTFVNSVSMDSEMFLPNIASSCRGGRAAALVIARSGPSGGTRARAHSVAGGARAARASPPLH